MQESKQRWLAFAVSVGFAIVAAIPYWIALNRVGAGQVFSGFLMNPIDGYSYLAKMQQGREGWWTFVLPYAADSGPRAVLFTFHLFLGHLARITGLPNLWVYHAARFAGSTLMFFCAYLLYRALLGSRKLVWIAFVLTGIGSGLGWLGALFGFLAIDLWVPEAIPFLSAYANAHFPFAAALFLIAILMFYDQGRALVTRAVLATLCGFLLAMIQPVVVISLILIVGLWFLVETEIRRRSNLGLLNALDRETFATIACFAIASFPVLFYQYLLARSHPALSIWNQQNLTPAPSIVELLLGYGLILILAVIGVVAQRLQKLKSGRLLIIWVLLSALLVYLPIPLQRRFLMGVFFPLSCLAAYGIQSLSSKKGISFKTLLVTVLIWIVPSNLFVIVAGLSYVQSPGNLAVYSKIERASYEWIVENLPEGSLLLIGPRGGNRVPAFGNFRVLYGHPFETPHAQAQLDQVNRFFSQELPSGEALDRLRQLGIDFVYFGPEERQLGIPAWIGSLSPIYTASGITIFEVPQR